MARCSNCGTTILFGGIKSGDFRFCNDKCYADGQCIMIANQIPNEEVLELAETLHKGSCPKCKINTGEIDVFTHYRVLSAGFFTQWNNTPQLSCKACGNKSRIYSAFYYFVMGWWGIPWGLIMTPVQIIRNMNGIFNPPDPKIPSEDMKNTVRIIMGKQIFMRTKSEKHKNLI